MRLSFVIPAYNEEYYIGECLKAITEQRQALPPADAANIEVIVVNNASTDGTVDVAKKYPGVTVVDEPQKGIVYARRAGYLASSGELIANIDADTRISPGWLVRVLSEFKNDDKLLGLSGPFIFYDAPWRVNLLSKVFNGIGYGFYLVIRFVLHTGSLLQGGNYVIRRDALEKIGGYNTSIAFYGEDTDIARRVNEIGKVKFTYQLPAYSSARRLAKEGVFTTGFRYATNILWITFAKHPRNNTQVAAARYSDRDTPSYQAEDPKLERKIRIGLMIALLVVILIAIAVIYYLYTFLRFGR
jgi:glycosyltransferase involved in cell wall biosynthesis